MKQEATIKIWIPDNSEYTVGEILLGLRKSKIKAEVISVFNPIKLPKKKVKR